VETGLPWLRASRTISNTSQGKLGFLPAPDAQVIYEHTRNDTTHHVALKYPAAGRPQLFLFQFPLHYAVADSNLDSLFNYMLEGFDQ
jgi:hypothetical protein